MLTTVTREYLNFETAGANGLIVWRLFKVDSVERIEAGEVDPNHIPPDYVLKEHLWRITSESRSVLLIGELARSVVN